MAIINPDFVISAIRKIYEIVNEIEDRISLLSLTGEQETRILRHVNTLNLLLEDLKPLQTRRDLPESFNQALLDLVRQLERCRDICQPVRVNEGKSLFEKGRSLLNVPDRNRLVGDLEKGLEGAVNNFTLILSAESLKAADDIQTHVTSQFTQITSIINNPDVGFFTSTSKISLKPPHKVEELAFEENGEFLDISWNDTKNKENSVLYYEMMYSDGKEEIYLPQIKSEDKFVRIGEPRVRPGKYYSFKIRAVNKGGHSEWSNEIRARFKKGVPERPTKPTIQVEGPNSVIVSMLQPTEDQGNGAPITSCIVEYAANDGNATMWESLICSLKECLTAENKIKVTIDKLNADTLYDFRVKFQNEVGCSPPSNSTTCQTHVPIPGIPEELRVSTKRTSSMIKIRWVPPSINPQTVDRYELQMRTKKGEWHHVAYSTKTSAKATGLKQDKLYFFRVQALNRKDQSCGFTDTIEAETRFGKAAKAALTPLVFVGGTLAAPFSSALAGGVGGGFTAAESVDNKAGAVAAGVAGGVAGGVGGGIVGTIGAPFVGGALAHTFVHWGDEYSDQSSDEDEVEKLKL